MSVFFYVQVEAVAVMEAPMGPAVAMEEVERMGGLEVGVAATMHTVANMEQEGVDIQGAAMDLMVGVAMEVMVVEGMEEGEVM
jgi:hypothetical protein